LKQAVLQAASIGYSTGPSGTELLKQFEKWGITESVKAKLMQAQPGIPVGALLAQGRVALGFQQLSEMMGVAGITVLGPLPEAVQVTTTFSGSVSVTCAQPQAVQDVLRFWASPATAALKQRHGMQAA
jgi:molybdate transport system substrate-binding protein